MCIRYGVIAMDVLREDWESRKGTKGVKLNQESIARMMGITRSQLSRSLKNNINPSLSFICAYATAVGRPVDEFLNIIGLRIAEEQRSMLISNQLEKPARIELS